VTTIEKTQNDQIEGIVITLVLICIESVAVKLVNSISAQCSLLIRHRQCTY